jgi:uncharacterized protein (TIGR02996 family)
MGEDEPFLRAILADLDDRASRLVYADWLDERADPGAEYLRLEVGSREMLPGHPDLPGLRRRMRQLQAQLPSWWVAIVGGLHATPTDPDPARVEAVAQALGRPVQYPDAEGYEISMHAAAASGLTGALAYLESRSQWQGGFHDIRYHLRLRDSAGREAAWEPETYNPFFGCRVGFLEWYGDVVLFIYREKHRTYVCRFGLNAPPKFQAIGDHWVLDGRHLGHRGYREQAISRLSVPHLDPLPPLSLEEAPT